MNDIESVTILVSAIGVLVAMSALIYQSIQVKKQMSLTVFMDYTKRYQEIILHFPESINEVTFSFEKIDPEERAKTLRYMRAYFDLCSEEYYLANEKKIGKEVWIDWASGIKYTFSKKAFRQAWDIIKLDTKYYRDFVNWVNDEALPDMNERI